MQYKSKIEKRECGLKKR